METTCIRHTDLPQTSRLFSDLVYHFDRVSMFYGHAPYDEDALEAAAAEIDFPAARRAAITAALAEQNPGHPALDVLAQPGTVAVVTGQQVGLFTGPAYTIFKALAAVRLARHLTEQGRPAVPVFWLATEDHDLAEINAAWIFDRDRQPIRLTSAAANPAGGPVGPIPVPNPPIEELRAALAGLPFADEVLAMASECYTPGVTFGAAFRKLLEKLIGHYGILFLDPLAPAIRRLAAPLLVEALDRSAELQEALLARNRELEAAGYHTQVHVEAGASLLFRLEPGRTPLKRQGDLFLAGNQKFTAAELAAEPERLSPNALLRPVMQDWLLPTIAYVGGPAELAYFAQSEVLYRALLGRMPVVRHRASFTLLDHRVSKVMAQYDLSLPETLVHEQALAERIAARLVPADLVDRFTALRDHLTREVAELERAAVGFDPSLAKAMRKSAAKIEYQLTKMREKAGREALRRDERATRQAGELHRYLYPHRHMQERFYSILPFLAEHGPDLIDRLFAATHVHCPDHQVLPIH